MGGAAYTLTSTTDFEITSATAFTITLTATDITHVNGLLNKDGATSDSGTTYNLAAAEDWMPGATTSTDIADDTNAISVSSVTNPAITSAAYDAGTGALVVTGTNFVNENGASNDVDVSLLTFTGEGSATYTVTSASDAEITSATSFTVTLSGSDKTSVNGLLNKDGTSSDGGTDYNLATADNWMPGAAATPDTADASNGITVSSVTAPAITSATYDGDTGVLVVTGTRFVNKDGTDNDVDISLLTITGEGGSTHTVASATDVAITSETSFSVTLSGSDKTSINSLLNNNGTSSDGGTTYNLAAADDWMPGAATATDIADTTENGITVSNTPRAVNLSLDETAGTEAGGTVITATATAEAAVSGDQTVNIASSGTNITSTDGSFSVSTITISSGATTGTSTFTILNDTLVEGTETATLTISNPSSGIALGSTLTGTVAITDNDTATVNLSVNGTTIAEAAGTRTITATLDKSTFENVVVSLGYAGTATNGTDYETGPASITIAAGQTTGTATLTATADTAVEAGETIIIDITGVSGGSASENSTPQQQTVTITDDDTTTVTLTASAATMDETSGTSTITATLDKVTFENVTVSLGYAGTAVSGTDYATPSSSITIPSGQTTGTATLTATGDSFVEAGETIIVDITGVSGGSGSESGSQQQTVTITDDDTTSVTLTISANSIIEASGTSTITATLDKVTFEDVTVSLGYSGTAVSGTDYSSPSSITITSGQTTGTGTLTATHDTVVDVEEDETVIIDITGVSGGSASESGSQQQTATITDDDEPIVTVANISISGASGTGDAFKINDTVTATWDNTASGDNSSSITGVTIDFSQFGGSTETASNSSETWTASYTIVTGSIDETSRNVSVSATNVSGTTTKADTTNATVDNIAPTVTDANISISGTSGTFKVGDTVTATWDNTSSGENNTDTISTVTANFGNFGGGATVNASENSGTWTATLDITEDLGGVIESSNLNISITATDNAGNTATATDTSNAALDNNTPAAPASLDLAASSDTGSSDSDNITNDTTPTITGTAEASSTVELFHSGTTSLGTGTADSSGNWSITATTTPDGAQSLTAKSTDAAGNVSAASTALSVTIDSGNPTISDITTQTIDEDANTGAVVFTIGDTITAADDLTLAKSSLDAALLTDANIVLGGTGTSRTVTATSESDKNGSVDVTITVTDASGNSSSDTFTLAVTAVNDAPVLAAQTPNLGTTDEDTTTAGITISSFVADGAGTASTATGLSEVDAGALRGIALSGKTGNGAWEFSADGTSWTAVGTVSSSAALLLPDSYQLHYVPDNQNEETPTLSYFGWDQTSGTPTSSVDLSGTGATGGTTAFSTATDTASLTVTAVNDTPVLAAIQATQSVIEHSELLFTASASDVDVPADTLTFSLDSGAPSGAIINSSTGEFSWTPTESQGPAASEITVRVTDDGASNLSAAQTITVNVSESNSEPTLGTITDQVINEGETMSVALSASDNDVPANTLTFDLVSGPSGMVVDGSSGLVTWPTGEADGPGSHTVTVSVSDNGSSVLSARRSFTVNVSESNSSPAIASIGDQIVKEKETLTLQISASDNDIPANQLSYALGSDAPTGTSLDAANGQFTWTPTEAQGPGTYTINVSVQDNGSPALTGTQSFQVAVEEVNQSPVLPSFSNNSVNEGEEIKIPLLAHDSDEPAQTLTWALGTGAPAGIMLDSTLSELIWTPSEAQGPGIYSFPIEVADNGTPVQTVSFTMTIAVNEINKAPLLAAVAPQAVVEGETLNLNLSATDSDLPVQQVNYSLGAGASAGAFINASTGQFTWLPGEAEGPGTYTITVIATDNGTPAASDSVSFTVEVAEGNRVPVLAPNTAQVVDEGQPLNVVLAATDPDVPAQNLSYGLGADAPAGVSVDSATGLLSWTPSEEQGPGSYSIAVEVSDDGVPPLIATGSVSVEVGEVNTAPVLTTIEDQTFAEGESLNLTAIATDADLPANGLTFSLGAGESAGMAIDSSTGVLSWTPDKTQSGATYDATVIVTDDGNLQDEKSFVVVVTAVNDAPTIGAISNQSTLDGVAVGPIAFTVDDVDNTPESLSVSGASSNTDLVALDGITIAGTGTDRTVNVQPTPNQTGVATITLEVSDSAGATSSVSFNVAVGFAAPEISQSPRDKTAVEGSSVVFTVGVSGTSPLSYQWLHSGVEIAGATQATLRLSSVTVNEEGPYTVRVSNAAGGVESQAATLIVNVPAQISDAQQDTVIAVGDPLNLVVNASGTPPLSYQWYFDGTPIDGATEVSFSIAAAELTDTGKFSVLVSNPVGAIGGPVFNVTVIEPILIVTQPQNIDAKKDDEVRMSVGVEGTGPFTYQWEFNGAIFRETSKPELILPGVQLNAAGNYRVKVSNLVGEAVSQEATLTVTGPAQLTGLPKLVQVAIGDDLILQVSAVGSPPFTFQWQLNGVNIADATTDTYRIPNVQTTDGGTYTVTVTDGGGATTSNLTSVIVITPNLGLSDDVGSASPTSAQSGDGSGNNVGAGSEAGEPSHAGGRPAKRSVWMAWNSPGVGIASFGTRGSGFDTILAAYKGSPDNLVQVASDEDGGGFLTSSISFNTEDGVTYFVAVDGFEGAQGAIALRWDWFQTAEPLPVITTQPQSQTVLFEQPVEFSVVGDNSGGSTLAYQWFLDGEIIANATGAALSLASAGVLDVGEYTVEVSNAGGMVTSTPAILQINLIATGSEGTGVDAVDKIGSSSQTGEQIVVGPASVGAEDTAANSIARRNARPIQRRSLLQGTRGEKLFSSKRAVKDAGEPNHCRVLGGASTWFVYEPPQSGALRVSTEGSSYDTVLAVYLSPTLDVDYSKLVEVACNDNGGSDGKTSVVEFSVEAGTRYYLVVDGVDGRTGIVHFTYEVSQTPVMSHPTWFAVDAASGQVDNTQENPVAAVGAGVEFRIGIGGLPSSASVSYQWRRNGIDVKGGTNERLLLSSLSQADSGNYSVEVTTFAGTAESQASRFTVAEPIQLLLNPDDQTLVAGRSAYFAVVPFGAGPFEYQWSLNGQALAGQTNAAVVVLDVQQSDAGIYEVAIADDVSQATASATLTVLEGLLIVNQPVSQSVLPGQSVQLSVNAQGVEPLSYQWQLNGVDVSGATTASLDLTNVQPTQAGEYTVVVSNSLETIVSDPAVVTVEDLSGVLLLGITRGAGDEVTLEVGGGEGVNVEVQSSEDFQQWTPVETVRIQNGQVTFNDPNAAGKSYIFYRLQVAL